MAYSIINMFNFTIEYNIETTFSVFGACRPHGNPGNSVAKTFIP